MKDIREQQLAELRAMLAEAVSDARKTHLKKRIQGLRDALAAACPRCGGDTEMLGLDRFCKVCKKAVLR